MSDDPDWAAIRDQAEYEAGGGVPVAPCWLIQHLPSAWRWLPDQERGVMVLLHPSGLWLELTADQLLWTHEGPGQVVLGELEQLLSWGIRGRVMLAVEPVPSGWEAITQPWDGGG